MSGFIGILIYAAFSQEQFEDQNKIFYILIGLPIWLIVRQLYWHRRGAKENQQLLQASELLEKYGTAERAIEVERFNIFEKSYKMSLIEDKNKGQLSESDFEKRVKALLIVGTEVEVGKELTTEEIDKLVGFEEHIQLPQIDSIYS